MISLDHIAAYHANGFALLPGLIPQELVSAVNDALTTHLAASVQPERFEGGKDAALPPGTYIPFGAGPRACVGQGFAQVEASLVLATLLQRCSVSRLEERPVKALPMATLTPERPVLLKLRPL